MTSFLQGIEDLGAASFGIAAQVRFPQTQDAPAASLEVSVLASIKRDATPDAGLGARRMTAQHWPAALTPRPASPRILPRPERNPMTADQNRDYDGCNRRCRLAGAHTLVWGECEHAPQPEPTVSLSCVYTDTDGQPSIGFDTYTVPELARLIEPVLVDPLKAAAAARRIVHRHDEQPAAVPVPPPADQTALRDRIAAALYERERPPRDPAWAEAFAMDREVFEAMADAVLAVLPEQADQTAVARVRSLHTSDRVGECQHCHYSYDPCPTVQALDGELRRVAAEEQPAKPDRCPHGCDTSICPCLACEAAEEQAAETPMFGSPDCTCIPFTRQGGKPRYCGPTDTVDMISGWEIGRDCPHHKPAVGEQPEAQETPNLPCSYWTLTRTEHTPHNWVPQPGMDPVHCPGYSRTPE